MEQIKIQSALEHQLRLEQLTSRTLARFTGISYETIDLEIELALEEVARFAGANRSSLFVFSDNQEKMSNTHEWCADINDSQITQLQNIPFTTFGFHKNKLENLETIVISSLQDYPPEAIGELKWIEENGFRSLLFIPLTKQNKLFGATNLRSASCGVF